MYVDTGKGSLIRLIAGLIIIGTVALGLTVSKTYLYVTGFVGLMLTFTTFTGL